MRSYTGELERGYRNGSDRIGRRGGLDFGQEARLGSVDGGVLDKGKRSKELSWQAWPLRVPFRARIGT